MDFDYLALLLCPKVVLIDFVCGACCRRYLFVLHVKLSPDWA